MIYHCSRRALICFLVKIRTPEYLYPAGTFSLDIASRTTLRLEAALFAGREGAGYQLAMSARQTGGWWLVPSRAGVAEGRPASRKTVEVGVVLNTGRTPLTARARVFFHDVKMPAQLDADSSIPLR